MKKSVKFLGGIVLLMVIGSLFVGVVSAEDIMSLYPCSGDTRSFCASTAKTYSVNGDVERVSNETDTIDNRKAGKVSVSPTPAPVTRYRTDGETYTFVAMWPEIPQPWYLDFPRGIAVDSSGYVYVADSGNNRIQKFDSDSNFITTWGSQGSGDGQFRNPSGIAVDSSGYVYVADSGSVCVPSGNNRIQKFDSDGTFITKWGSYGTGDGEFIHPWSIAVDSSGYVYVADSGNHRIQKFDSDGTFITKWGSNGAGEGEFDWPVGIAVDSSGYVYVAERLSHK
jgi:DNA-binding beta-propeller fold protein YncE